VGQGALKTNTKRAGGLFLATVLAVMGVTVAVGRPAGASTIRTHALAGAMVSGRAVSGTPFGPVTAADLSGVGVATTGGSGYLTVFQEASSAPLAVSIDGLRPVDLPNDNFTYGLIPAGTHTVTATSGSTTVATGSVTVPAGQHVTAVVYLAPGGAPTITGFVNDKSAPPAGESRIVVRNTADSGPVDLYVNGSLVAGDVANDPSAPVSVPSTVRGGTVSIAVTDAGQPLADALTTQTGDLAPGDLLNLFVVGTNTGQPDSIGLLTNAIPLGAGYRLYASDGGVFNFGSAAFYGSTGGMTLNKPVVGAATTAVGFGYWLVASDGGVFSFGDASFYGSTGAIRLNKPIVGMASTPDQGGYWLVASDGGVFSFGDAHFYGSTGAMRLNQPIVGIATTPDGKGYWLVASDGGIFSFGDASFYGSTGSLALNKPIVGMAPTVDGYGYWLVASDGGVFSFGDASFYGSTGAVHLNKPVVGVVATPDSLGYWLVASDGGIFSGGDASFYGSTGSLRLNKPIVWGSAPGIPLPS
jgi:hypothetical protein